MPHTETCGMLIRQVSEQLTREANKTLEKQDLTLSQVYVLQFLKENPSDTVEVKELVVSLHVSQPTVSGLLSRLEDKGLVTVRENPKNRRAKLIRLTEPGRNICLTASDSIRAAENSMFSGIPKKEQELLKSCLRRIRENGE